MYNEISLSRAKNRSNLSRAATGLINANLAGLLQNTDKEALMEANKQAINRLMSTMVEE